VDLSKTTSDHFGKFHDWNEMLGAGGPFDEPSFCFEDAWILVRDNGFFRQAVAPLERVRQLVPDYLPARLLLGQIYLASRLPDRALDVLRDPLNDPQKFLVDETNGIQLNILVAAAYFQKDDNARGTQLLESEISSHPTNDNLLVTAAQMYMVRGLLTNALAVINHKLKSAPDDPTWLFSKGYVCLQIKDYDGAITSFDRVLSIQTNNLQALFSRANAYLDSGKLDDARADYEKLQQTYTNSFQAAYNLGEIAWRKHETNEAIRNYEIYLANAKTNTPDATNVIERLKLLRR